MEEAEDTGSINNDCEDPEIEDYAVDDSENRELVNDSCSTKVLSADEPQDSYNTVYILFYLFGVTSLVPWNFIMTANDYWMFKFRDTTQNLTAVSEKTRFQAEFTSYLNVATAVPNLLFLVLNSLYGHWVPLRHRLQGSLVIILISFLVTTAFVQVDTDKWQNEFLVITMVSVIVMTAASAIFIGGLYGIAGKFSNKYMAAVVSGQSLGGIIAAVAQILSLAFKISPLHSALIYFCIADIMIVLSLGSFMLMYKLDFFMHNALKGSGRVTTNRHRTVSLAAVLKKIWVYALSIFAVFAITMCVYPGVTANVQSYPADTSSNWKMIFFVPVVNYLIFNCGDYGGRIVAGLFLWPLSQWIIAVGCVLRVLFVPLLMLCNALPRTYLPIVFKYDTEFIALMVAFSFTNGYLTNITFINSAKAVEPHEREKASSIIATMLSLGLSVGAAIGIGLVKAI